MDDVKPWLKALAVRQLSSLIGMKDDVKFGDELKRRATWKPQAKVTFRIDQETCKAARRVQIVKFKSYKDPISALVSDSESLILAIFSDSAAEAFANSCPGRITEGTTGGVVGISTCELAMMPDASGGSICSLTLEHCKYLGCGGAGTVGSPQQLGQSENLQASLRGLSRLLLDYRPSDANVTGVTHNSLGNPFSRYGGDDNELVKTESNGTQLMGSQDSLSTQMPFKEPPASEGNRPSSEHDGSGANARPVVRDPNLAPKTATSSTNSNEALLRLLPSRTQLAHIDAPAHVAGSRSESMAGAPEVQVRARIGNPQPNEERGRDERAPSGSQKRQQGPNNPRNSATGGSSGRQGHGMNEGRQSSIGDGQTRSGANANGNSDTARSMHFSPTQFCAVQAGDDDPWKGMTRIRKREVRISKSQQRLVEREDNWLPPEPGCRAPTANLPENILEDLTGRVEQSLRRVDATNASRSPPSPRSQSGSQPDRGSYSPAPEHFEDSEPIEWESSPPRNIARGELPPDTSPLALHSNSAHGGRKRTASPLKKRRSAPEQSPALEAAHRQKRSRVADQEEAIPDASPPTTLIRSEKSAKGTGAESVKPSASAASPRQASETVSSQEAARVVAPTRAPSVSISKSTPSGSQPKSRAQLWSGKSKPRPDGPSATEQARKRTRTSGRSESESDTDESLIEASVPSGLGERSAILDHAEPDLPSRNNVRSGSVWGAGDPIVQVQATTRRSRPGQLEADKNPPSTPTHAAAGHRSAGEEMRKNGAPASERSIVPSTAPIARTLKADGPNSSQPRRSLLRARTAENSSKPRPTQPPSTTRQQIKDARPTATPGSPSFTSSAPLPTPCPNLAGQPPKGVGSRVEKGQTPVSRDSRGDREGRPRKTFRLKTPFGVGDEGREFRDTSELVRQQRLEFFRNSAEHPNEPSNSADDPSPALSSSGTKRQRSGIADGDIESGVVPSSHKRAKKDSGPQLGPSVTRDQRPDGHARSLAIPDASSRQGNVATSRQEQPAQALAPQQTEKSAVQVAPASTADPASRNIFDRFRLAYPAYIGSLSDFVAACAIVEWLFEDGRMEHRLLWDEFVFRFAMDYMPWCQRNDIQSYTELPYERFFKEKVYDRVCTQNVISSDNLLTALELDYASAGQMRYQVLASLRGSAASDGGGRLSFGSGVSGQGRAASALPWKRRSQVWNDSGQTSREEATPVRREQDAPKISASAPNTRRTERRLGSTSPILPYNIPPKTPASAPSKPATSNGPPAQTQGVGSQRSVKGPAERPQQPAISTAERAAPRRRTLPWMTEAAAARPEADEATPSQRAQAPSAGQSTRRSLFSTGSNSEATTAAPPQTKPAQTKPAQRKSPQTETPRTNPTQTRTVRSEDNQARRNTNDADNNNGDSERYDAQKAASNNSRRGKFCWGPGDSMANRARFLRERADAMGWKI